MITHDDFGRLPLLQFLPAGPIEPLSDWEFIDSRWVGEAHGFTEFLRLENDPTVVRSIALDLAALPPEVAERVLDAIGLHLRAGMKEEAVIDRLGAPHSVQRFPKATDRVTYDFKVGPDQYDVSCTIQQTDGLVYVVITSTASRRRPRRRA